MGLQTAEEVALVEVVLEGLAAVDQHDRNLVVVEGKEGGIRVDVDGAPGEIGAGGEAGELVLDHVAEVASKAGVKDDLVGHEGW